MIPTSRPHVPSTHQSPSTTQSSIGESVLLARMIGLNRSGKSVKERVQLINGSCHIPYTKAQNKIEDYRANVIGNLRLVLEGTPNTANDDDLKNQEIIDAAYTHSVYTSPEKGTPAFYNRVHYVDNKVKYVFKKTAAGLKNAARKLVPCMYLQKDEVKHGPTPDRSSSNATNLTEDCKKIGDDLLAKKTTKNGKKLARCIEDLSYIPKDIDNLTVRDKKRLAKNKSNFQKFHERFLQKKSSAHADGSVPTATTSLGAPSTSSVNAVASPPDKKTQQQHVNVIKDLKDRNKTNAEKVGIIVEELKNISDKKEKICVATMLQLQAQPPLDHCARLKIICHLIKKCKDIDYFSIMKDFLVDCAARGTGHREPLEIEQKYPQYFPRFDSHDCFVDMLVLSSKESKLEICNSKGQQIQMHHRLPNVWVATNPGVQENGTLDDAGKQCGMRNTAGAMVNKRKLIGEMQKKAGVTNDDEFIEITMATDRSLGNEDARVFIKYLRDFFPKMKDYELREFHSNPGNYVQRLATDHALRDRVRNGDAFSVTKDEKSGLYLIDVPPVSGEYFGFTIGVPVENWTDHANDADPQQLANISDFIAASPEKKYLMHCRAATGRVEKFMIVTAVDEMVRAAADNPTLFPELKIKKGVIDPKNMFGYENALDLLKLSAAVSTLARGGMAARGLYGNHLSDEQKAKANKPFDDAINICAKRCLNRNLMAPSDSAGYTDTDENPYTDGGDPVDVDNENPYTDCGDPEYPYTTPQ